MAIQVTRTYVGFIQNQRQVQTDLDSLGDSASKSALKFEEGLLVGVVLRPVELLVRERLAGLHDPLHGRGDRGSLYPNADAIRRVERRFVGFRDQPLDGVPLVRRPDIAVSDRRDDLRPVAGNVSDSSWASTSPRSAASISGSGSSPHSSSAATSRRRWRSSASFACFSRPSLSSGTLGPTALGRIVPYVL